LTPICAQTFLWKYDSVPVTLYPWAGDRLALVVDDHADFLMAMDGGPT
jgi:hypothetical protein